MDSTQKQPSEATVLTPIEDRSKPDHPKKGSRRVDGIVIWAILCIATLGWIAVGSVDARVWRFSRLRIESISVLKIWEYQTNNLPQVSQQWILNGVFVLALLVFVFGVIAAAWLLMVSSVDQPETDVDGPGPTTSTQA